MKKSLRLTLIVTLIVTLFTSTVFISSAYEITPHLGGGPSPSAAWERVDSFTVKLSKSQIETLQISYQDAMSSTRYRAGGHAYKASLTIAGFCGIKTLFVKGAFEVTVGGLGAAAAGLFGQTYFSKIQDASNRASSLSARMRNGEKRQVTIDVYARPANGEAMFILR